MGRLNKKIAAAVVMGVLLLGFAACGLSPEPYTEAVRKDETIGVSTETGAVDESYGISNMSTQGYWPQEEIPYNTEEYSSVEESGFVATATSPLSTVSADVDTASYANLRRMLRDGYTVQSKSGVEKPVGEEAQEYELYPDYYAEAYSVIPAGAVRIEEMLNYFSYDYDKPSEKDGFAITKRMGKCPWNADTELLVLGFATAPEDKSVTEKGSNLVFLIDVSGSMDDPDKLPLLQSAFGELVGQLGEQDRVSIVTYSGEERVVLEGVSGSDHTAIMRAVRSLKADGSTNGEAGLRMAYKVAQDHFIEGGVNRIVMASDGDLNVGMTSESDLHDYVKAQRDSGIYLSVLGFGAGNYKDSKMETIADNGNGSYHYIDCEEEAKRVFGERLCANLVPFANDVKVQVEFNPSFVKGYRLVGYENRRMAAEDFKDDSKDAGDVGPSSQFTVVYEIVRTDSPMEIATPELKYGKTASGDAATTEWLTAKLRYKPIGGSEVKETSAAMSEADWSDNPGSDWRFAAAVTEFGMILRDSDHKGSSSYDSVRKLVGDTDDELRAGFLELVDLAEKN
ncbi:MAG: VWA domain-containing protein [Coriobacteriales bacterium]|nr:VWA domain-containing protein [Coriobacteriales bacterium]